MHLRKNRPHVYAKPFEDTSQFGDLTLPVPTLTVNRLSAAAIGAVCLLSLFFAIHSYPLGWWWMVAGIAIYFACLWRNPSCWLTWIPAALPVLDFAPWTGRFFFDEFDCLLIATLLWKSPQISNISGRIPLPATVRKLLLCIFLSALISLLIGIAPFMPIDLNSFNNYFSPFNALRICKGLFFALLLLPIFQTELAVEGATSYRRFALGMTIGVALGAIGVLWERTVFTGLFNFHSAYRVVGLFSGMHIGGSYIEAYFATSLPFVAWWTLHAQSRARRMIGALIFALGTYSLVVTYARGAYLALVIGMLVLASTFHAQRLHGLRPWLLRRGIALIALLAVIALPVLEGTAMQRRYATSQRDLWARAAHWMDAIHIMTDSGLNQLFGMGLGSYPRQHYLHSAENAQSALYMLADENGRRSLLISSGEPVYIEQFANISDQHDYVLTFVAHNIVGHSELMFPICEKWMLYSVNCLTPSVTIDAENGQSQRFTLRFDGSAFRTQTWLLRRPVKFAMFNNSDDAVAAISDVSLRDEKGHEYLQNGDFAQGMDHWFFTSDNHLPWHLENLWVQIYFEQGAFGLLIFSLLVIMIIVRLIKLNRLHHPFAPALSASIAAFLALSIIDSVFDFPRMSFLFYMIVIQTLLLKSMQDSIELGKQ
jgi:hypothetical protein